MKLATMDELADRVNQIVNAAIADLGPDFGGAGSVFDLCYDQIEDLRFSAADLRVAIIVSGCETRLSPRIQKQIANYR